VTASAGGWRAFYYCGIIEERNLTVTFPQAYPEYKSRTKMLIPFLL
jgi:protein-S-isoprenylcysteine O-methyltransferase Ste14